MKFNRVLPLAMFCLVLLCTLSGTFAALSDTNMLAFYTFDTSSKLIDEKGFDNNGTNTATSLTSGGIIPFDYNFTTTSSKVDLASTNGTYSRLTLSIWVKIPAFTGATREIFGFHDAVNDNAYIRATNNANTFGCIVNGGGSATSNTFTPDSWNHIVLDYNGTHVKCILNGILTTGTPVTPGNVVATATMKIGAGATGGTTAGVGEYDQAAIFNWDLSTADVNLLWNNGLGVTYKAGTFYYPYVQPRYSYVINKANTQVEFTDTSALLGGATATAYNWTINGVSQSTTQNYNYTTTQLTDLNACLTVTTNPAYSDMNCQQFNTGDWEGPTTTFSSFQVSNRTDQNISLTCTDNNSGCKKIYYNINNTGWNQKNLWDYNTTQTDTNNTSQSTTSSSFVLVKSFDLNTTSVANLDVFVNATYSETGATGDIQSYVIFTYSDNTTLQSGTISCTDPCSRTFQNNNYTLSTKRIDIYLRDTSGASNIKTITNTDVNYKKPILFLTKNEYINYSGSGDHNIQYFSADNSDNNGTTESSLFTTYGTGHFIFKDQNSGLDLNGVTVTSTRGDNNTLVLNRFDTNFDSLGATNTQVTYTFTKSGYATRYYSNDLNQFSDFNVTFAMLPDSIDADVPFKVYQTDASTLFTDTYVEVLDKDTNWSVGRLKTNSSGEVTFNLRADDSNYWTVVNNGQFTYTPVTVTINYPKNELTLAQITELYRIDITQNLYASYSNLNAAKIVYLLPNTSNPYNIRIQDMNGNYFARNYAKVYPGNPLTDTLQPYLVPTASGLLTTINTIDATRLTPVANITIKIYKYISGSGRTYVEQVTTDTKGQALVLLQLAAEYEFEIYQNNVLLRTDPITATSASIDIKIPSSATQNTDNNFYIVNVAYIPNRGKLLTTDLDLNQTITIKNNGSNAVTITQILVWVTSDDGDYNFFNASIPVTGTTTINSIDVNFIDSNYKRRTINGKTYDQNMYITINTQITTSDGNTTFKTMKLGLPSTFSISYGLGAGLKPNFGCPATPDPLFPCPTMLLAALFISMIATIGLAAATGFASMETMGVIFLAFMGIFVYLTWVPALLYGLMILVTVVIGVALGGNRL